MDPLRPFTTLIRGLWKAQRTGRQDTSSANRSGDGAQNQEPPGPGSVNLQALLGSRIRALGDSTTERRRRVFVETVLLAELEPSASADPRFSDLVSKVAAQLGSDANVSSRLDAMLRMLPGPAFKDGD